MRGKLGLAALGLLLALAFLLAPPRSPAPGPGAPERSSPTQAAPPAQPAREPDEHAVPAPARAAPDAGASLVDLIPRLPGLRIQIVAAEDGRPLPGAEAAWRLHDRYQDVSFRLHREPAASGREPEDEAFFSGETTRADHEGWISVPLLPWTILVSARHGDLAGSGEFEPGERNPTRLALHATRFLEIRVVDETGAPQANVPVLLRDGTRHTRWRGLTAGPQGSVRARIPCSPFKERLDSRELHAGFQMPISAYHPLLPVDYETLKPVQLVLPPTGRLVVRLLDEAGRPFSSGVNVSLDQEETGNPEEPEPSWNNVVEAETRDGEATFAWVGLGRRWSMNAMAQDRSLIWRLDAISGPTRPGETVRVEANVDERNAARFRCRMVDRTGLPLAGILVRVRQDYLDDGELESGSDTLSRTGTDGGLVIHGCAWPGIDRTWFRFTWWRHTGPGGQPLGPWGVALLEGPFADRSEKDLGDIVLAGDLPFLSGIVRNLQEEPIEDANVELRPHLPGKEGQAANISAMKWRTSTNADGKFFLPVHDRGPWTLSVEKHPATMTWNEPILPDRQGMVIHLDYRKEIIKYTSGSVEFDLLVDPDLPDAEMTIDVTPESKPRNAWFHFNDSPVRTAPDRYTYKSRWIVGSPLKVEIKVCGTTLATVAAVPIDPAEAAQGPRIPPVDLRGKLRLLRLQVETPDGPLTGCLTCAVQAPGQAIGLSTFAGTLSGRFEILIPAEAQAICVGSGTSMPVEVLWAPEEQRIFLRQGPRVKLPKIPPWLRPDLDKNDIEITLKWKAILLSPPPTSAQQKIISFFGAMSDRQPSSQDGSMNIPAPGLYQFSLYAFSSIHRFEVQGTPFAFEVEDTEESLAPDLPVDESRFRELQQKLMERLRGQGGSRSDR